MVTLTKIFLICLLMQWGTMEIVSATALAEMQLIPLKQQQIYLAKAVLQRKIAFNSLCTWFFKQSEEKGMTSSTPPPQAPSVRIENQQLTDTELENKVNQGLFHAEIAEVELPSNRLTSKGVAALLESPIRSLQVLNLYDNQIGDSGAALIAEAEKLKGVNRLDVSYNNLSFKGVQALFGSESRLSGPTWLDIAGNPIGDAGIQLIVESRYAQHLRGLSIRRTGMTDVGARHLATTSSLANLQHLNVSGNELTSVGRDALTNSPYLKETRILFE